MRTWSSGFTINTLPFTGITWLPHYSEPLRHPTRPGLSLTSCRLIQTAITAGVSRVASGPLCLHAVANTPAGPTGLFARTPPSTAAFPVLTAGRLLRYSFRGLLSVHFRYSLHP